MTSEVIAISLGANNSYVSAYLDGKIEIIPNDYGEKKTPSYVAFTDTEILIGQPAKDQMSRNPRNTIFNFERLLGRYYDDREIKEDLKYLPFQIKKDNNYGKIKIKVVYQNEEKEYFPLDIASMLIEQLKKDACQFLGKEIREAVISVPNYYSLTQIEEIKEATINAGLFVKSIMRSTAAGSFTYYYDKILPKEEKNILIFDLGGGTLNISTMVIEEGLLAVKSINGNVHLGGEDFNYRLLEYCATEFRNKTGLDVFRNPKVVNKLFEACENAKIALSSSEQTSIEIEYLMDNEDFNIEITRIKFEDLCSDLFKRCISSIDYCIKDSQISKEKIDEIILVGGSSRIPKIQQMIKDFFLGKELNTELNPDEAISFGLAIKAGMMDKVKDEKVENWTLLDVYPYSLGVKTVGGVMKAFTKKNSYCFRAEITRDFTTYYDNQTCAYVEFYEGERQLVKDNIYIGMINFDGIPPMPRGKPQIQIKLKIDESFNFYAEVKEKSTGNTNREISKNKGLTGCFDQPLIDEDNFMNYQNMMNNMNYSNMMNNMNMINNMNMMNNMNYSNMMNNLNYSNMINNMNMMNNMNYSNMMNNMNYPNIMNNMNYQ